MSSTLQRNELEGLSLARQEFFYETFCVKRYRILLSIVQTFFNENDAEILHARYTWKVAFTTKQSIQVKLLNEGTHYTCMHTLLHKIRYFITVLSGYVKNNKARLD